MMCVLSLLDKGRITILQLYASTHIQYLQLTKACSDSESFIRCCNMSHSPGAISKINDGCKYGCGCKATLAIFSEASVSYSVSDQMWNMALISFWSWLMMLNNLLKSVHYLKAEHYATAKLTFDPLYINPSLHFIRQILSDTELCHN